MPIPLIPIIWATTQYATIAAVIKGTVWGSARFVQHGFDYEATVAQLERDLHATKEFGGAAGKLLPALAKLRLGNDFPDIVSAAYAIKRMLDSLPRDFIRGLNKSISLEASINKALKQALYRSGVSYLVHATSDTNADTSVRLHAFYFGLLLVNRSENTLGAHEQEHAIDTLVQLHDKRNTHDDRTVVGTLKAFAHDRQSLAVHQQLFKAPEVWAMAAYDAPHMVLVRIAAALGDNLDIKPYDTTLTYLTTYFEERVHA